MQTERYRNGDLVTKIFTAPTDEELRLRMKQLHAGAVDAGAIEIRQAVMEPDLPCPCGSGRKCKNCCLRRYRSIMANAGIPLPPVD